MRAWLIKNYYFSVAGLFAKMGLYIENSTHQIVLNNVIKYILYLEVRILTEYENIPKIYTSNITFEKCSFSMGLL